ncbi:MAG: hypothetical protein ABI603_13555 [Acidobacteriota bacterium]
MRAWRVLVSLAAVLTALPASPARGGADPDRLWMAPAPGSLDYTRLFLDPSEWPDALRVVDVFKFYQQHTLSRSDPVVGPNTYDALVQAGAFRTVTRSWRKKIALEVGAVKEFYCTDDDSGMQEAIDATLASVEAVQRAGGIVSYLAIDEPFLAGMSPRCGGPSLAPTADRLAVYMKGVRRVFPWVRIGLIEAYPSFSPGQFTDMIRLMRERGWPLAFLHADVDLRAMRPGRDDFGRDMNRLAALSAEERLPFGIIIWGENGNADALFSADAMRLEEAVESAFGRWDLLPPHLIVQSWAESSSGLRITPTNLPQSRADTFTELLLRVYLRLFATRKPTHG